MIHKSRPIFSTQFHPEAKGGPLDSSYLFDDYLESVNKFKNSQVVTQPYRDSRPSPLLVDLLSKERVGVVPDFLANEAAAASPPPAATSPASPVVATTVATAVA